MQLMVSRPPGRPCIKSHSVPLLLWSSKVVGNRACPPACHHGGIGATLALMAPAAGGTARAGVDLGPAGTARAAADEGGAGLGRAAAGWAV